MNLYGEGYEQATEPGPDVEMRVLFDWIKRDAWTLVDGITYRRPIKLRVGERYRMRNGFTVEIVANLPGRDFPYRSAEGNGYKENGRFLQGNTADALDIIEHIPKQPKEKPMNEKMIEVNAWCAGTECKSRVEVTLAEAERLGAEAQRIKAENEIKVGDYFFFKGFQINKSKSPDTDYWTKYELSECKKITNPAHIQALTEIYEAHK